MRNIAIILNIFLISTVIYLVKTEGVSNDYILRLILFFATPIFSLIAFFFGAENNWISLFFKRKALEEKKKIESLS